MSNYDDVKAILLRDEGLSLRPYKDTEGHLTIGVGRNLDAKGISNDEAFMLLDNDIDEARSALEQFDWYHLLTCTRQTALVCMVFNLGIGGFREFKNMIAALESGDYDRAHDEMLDSQWALQVKDRAKRLAEMIKEG